MEYQIMWNVKVALGMTFPDCKRSLPWPILCELIEKLKPVQRTFQVVWKMPNNGKLKVNTDGSYIKSIGKVGIGGIIRDESGNMIEAFCFLVDCFSNNIAEALAANFGANLCIQKGWTNFELQLDSLLVADMLKKEDTRNQKLKMITEETLQILGQADVQITHRYTGANLCRGIWVRHPVARVKFRTGSSTSRNKKRYKKKIK